MSLRDGGSLLIILSAAGSWTFCLAYSFLAPWWKKPAGRQVWLQSAALGLVLTVWSIGLATEAGNAQWFQVLRLVAFVPVPMAIWGQLILLLNVNRIAWRDLRRDR